MFELSRRSFLAAAGVRVRHRREPGMIHGFLSMDRVAPSAAAAADRFFADVADVRYD